MSTSKVFAVKVQLTAIVQSKKITRVSEVHPVAAISREAVDVETCNRPENLHRFIPRFIVGKSREFYKVSKVLEVSEQLGNK